MHTPLRQASNDASSLRCTGIDNIGPIGMQAVQLNLDLSEARRIMYENLSYRRIARRIISIAIMLEIIISKSL